MITPEKAFKAVEKYGSIRNAANALGMAKSTLWDYVSLFKQGEVCKQAARVLTFDLETAPNIAYVWGAFKQNISEDMMIEKSYIMSFSAKWLGEENIIYCENRHNDEQPLIKEMLALLDEADVVIAHNAKKFDVPTIQGRAAVNGFNPPSPFKVVDTLASARKHFRFPKYTLKYLCEMFDCSPKLPHEKFPGFKLWLECLRDNDEAWEEMRVYNMQDVISLEELYLHMRPWITPHPNVATCIDTYEHTCPRCGSENIRWDGVYHTPLMEYPRFQCKDCGGWGRGRANTRTKQENATKLAVV